MVVTLFLILPVVAHADQWSGNVNFLLGAKSMESDDWSPVDDHGAFGVLVDWKKQGWPVSIAIDILGSYDEETVSGIKFEGQTSEINAGVRKIWEVSGSSVRPYIGGGIAFVSAEGKGTLGFTLSESDSSAGIWLNGGVYWTLGQSFNIGLDLRVSRAEVTLFGVDVEAGGNYAGLLLGYHW